MLAELVDDLKRKVLTVLSRKEEPDDPEEPFAKVGAPVKPRRPLNSSAVAVNPEL